MASLRFIKGGKFLDINSGWYKVASGFFPPATQTQPTYASSPSGSDLVWDEPVNQDYAVPLHITATNVTGVRLAASRLQQFLSQAGDTAEPLYLGYREHADYDFEPTLGELDCFHRYEVVKADIIPNGQWYLSISAGAVPNLTIQMVIKPHKTIRPMRLGEAKGAVFMDNVATAEGRSRGVEVLPALTNRYTNPVFGEGAVTGWTTSNVTATVVSDPEHVLFGRYAVRLESTGATGVFVQTLTLTTDVYNASFYVKKGDGSAVTTADIQFRHAGSNVNYGYLYPLENGWYRVQLSQAGVVTASTYGVIVPVGHTVYIDGLQISTGITSRFFPLVYGDRLGCSWSGTAHQSDSSSTAGYIRFPYEQYFNLEAFSFRFVWRANSTRASETANFVLLDTNNGASGHRLFYNDADETFRLLDGTQAAVSSTITWSNSTIVTFHGTFDIDNGIKLYINGLPNGSNATYTKPTTPTHFYVGSSNTPDAHVGGTIMGFAVYPFEMTAAQVLADYQRTAPHRTEITRLDAVPFLWTKDGDSIVDEFNDADEDNYCVMGEIPGDYNPGMLFDIVRSAGGGNNLWLSGYSYREYFDPINLYKDFGGTPTAGTDSNSDVTTQSVGTTEVSLGSTLVISDDILNVIGGDVLTPVVRARDNGTNLLMAWQMTYAVSGPISTSEFMAVNSNAAISLMHRLPSLAHYDLARLRSVRTNQQHRILFQITAKRSSGAAANVLVDLAMLCTNLTEITADVLSNDIHIALYKSISIDRGSLAYPVYAAPRGLNPPDGLSWIAPGNYNVLIVIPSATHNLAWGNMTATFSRAFAEPRYRLL